MRGGVLEYHRWIWRRRHFFFMEKLWNSNYIKVNIANFMSSFSFMVLAPLLPLYLSDTFGADKHTIGVVLSGYTVVALIARLFSGYITDSFPRKRVLLISYGVFALFFSFYLGLGALPATLGLTLFTIVRTLHGGPMGLATTATTTAAIDVLPSSRRAEGIGYYGISNNLGTAIAPFAGLYAYDLTQSYTVLFALALVAAVAGFVANSTVHIPVREIAQGKAPVSFDRFILTEAWRQGAMMACFAFCYGVVSTYLAIYGKEELGMTTGTGGFFLLLSAGLMTSRLFGARSLRQGRVTHNAGRGMLVSLVGYTLFAACHNPIGYYGCALLVGLGNGHMYPATQTMFVNLAPNSKRGTASSTFLTSWDIGMGIGVIAGGILSEHLGYGAAFWCAAAVNLCGVMFFFLSARRHFNNKKLR